MRIAVAVAALAALCLTGCGRSMMSSPQGSKVAAAMPDTTQPREPGREMTAPDAGETGAVPANGGPPRVAPSLPPAKSQ